LEIHRNFASAFRKPQKFRETIYARVAELVLGVPGLEGRGGRWRAAQAAPVPAGSRTMSRLSAADRYIQGCGHALISPDRLTGNGVLSGQSIPLETANAG
jgi:hypothetical protein